jgi:hypothetical protein
VTPEGRVKAKVKSYFDKYSKHVWYYMPVSGGMGQHGIPDFICCVRGKFFAIECKVSDKRGVTNLQALQLSRINNAGGHTLVIFDSDDSFNLLESYLHMMVTGNEAPT